MRALFFWPTLLFSLASAHLHAISFIKTTLESRIERADSIILGTYRGRKFKKMHTGEVVTELSFKLKEIAGVTDNSVLGHEDFKVTIPGGEWQGVSYHVSGTPRFLKSEKVVLLLKRGKYGYRLQDFEMSKLSFKEKGKRKFLKTALFSQNQREEIIDFKKFRELVAKSFHGGLQGPSSVAYDFGEQKNQKKTILERDKRRAPASLKKREKSRNLDFFWLILVLGLAGSISGYNFKNNEDY